MGSLLDGHVKPRPVGSEGFFDVTSVEAIRHVGIGEGAVATRVALRTGQPILQLGSHTSGWKAEVCIDLADLSGWVMSARATILRTRRSTHAPPRSVRPVARAAASKRYGAQRYLGSVNHQEPALRDREG